MSLCQQVLAHRGAHDVHQENSMAAFTSAFERGVAGIELDVYFDPEHSQFIVSHDEPTASTLASHLLLANVLQQFGTQLYYWVDFKNLGELSNPQRLQALKRLQQLSYQFVPKSQFVIESIAVEALVPFTKADFITSYWLTLTNDMSMLTFANFAFRIKAKYLLGQFSVISTDVSNYSDRFQWHFPNITTLLFTVNDPNQIRYLFEQANVRVILSDLPSAADFEVCNGV
ncbi:glycerophosphodiester phosphodiesterase [Shewanella sp. NIFS-20-20]|nr:glycerophosphodiester phosphodiesterase [Shewanella sp. NIFS-20-20]